MKHNIEKGLLLFYESTNHTMRVNYVINCEKLRLFCLNVKNKRELVSTLRGMISRIEKEYPTD